MHFWIIYNYLPTLDHLLYGFRDLGSNSGTPALIMSNLGIWRAPPSGQTPEIWQQPWRSWNGAPCAGGASLALGCTGSSQRETARRRELGQEKFTPNESFLLGSRAHSQDHYNLTVRLLTILQKFQFVVQILPIYRDQSHDHVAVTCQNIADK